eukprot:CAMPEP_0184380870 /NCGR_PEP_ID=MMETSP0007-20130409/5115_1 /TAXON_ID=97485 /ORGANISM="Prymnesium parvum, Strain Texoma1" /LENGTH=49 /DNA_ID= /DNA_START= /DNA_END= /DNA_ORIENTATION=
MSLASDAISDEFEGLLYQAGGGGSGWGSTAAGAGAAVGAGAGMLTPTRA